MVVRPLSILHTYKISGIRAVALFHAEIVQIAIPVYLSALGGRHFPVGIVAPLILGLVTDALQMGDARHVDIGIAHAAAVAGTVIGQRTQIQLLSATADTLQVCQVDDIAIRSLTDQKAVLTDEGEEIVLGHLWLLHPHAAVEGVGIVAHLTNNGLEGLVANVDAVSAVDLLAGELLHKHIYFPIQFVGALLPRRQLFGLFRASLFILVIVRARCHECGTSPDGH